eukprot:m.573046 g.573046  ORF g.573046 m.573046 type:complete len:86 (-) comp57874_c0_seq2:44-301(-)
MYVCMYMYVCMCIADELLLLLVVHEKQDVMYSACGVLMNMMMESTARAALKQSAAVFLLCEQLLQSAQSDWLLAGQFLFLLSVLL